MTVYFIGAGPGALDLLTVRAINLIKNTQVCLYAGSILPQEIMDLCPDSALKINTARMPLTDIISTIRTYHERGYDIVRLHSGDPSIYSAMNEQIQALGDIPYSVVPGVPSYAAAAAAIGQELTVPEQAQTLILSRISGRASAMPAGEDLASLASHKTTLCLHLAAHDQDRISSELIPFYGKDCPVVVVAYASRPEEEIVRTTLENLSRDAGHIKRTAIIFIGPVLEPKSGKSFLYSDSRERDADGRTVVCEH